MIIATLFSLFVGEIVRELYVQKVGDSVLHTWANYTQGNHDVQLALKSAFVKTPGAIALALSPEPDLMQRLKLTTPKLSREFAESIDTNYVNPFCGGNQALEQKLRTIAKAQCKALSAFFAEYPFRDVPVEDVATLLYNTRFITTSDIVRKQVQLTKAALKSALSQAEFDQDFIEFLFFPETGNGILYDGVIYHFEEEIKANERVSNILAHFDRQQILANSERTRNDYADLKQQIAALEASLSAYSQPQESAELAAISNQLADLQAERQALQTLITASERNTAVWQQTELELNQVRERFGELNLALSGHFDDLQKWLDGEFDDVKTTVTDEGEKVREHVSQEVDKIARLVRQELQYFFNGQSELQVEEIDFLAKPYTLSERYGPLEPLGGGGLATVYKTTRNYLNSIVALKILSPKYQHDPEVIARFWTEGKIMGSLSGIHGHHFAKVREMGQSTDGRYFLEMDFVAGKTLETLLKEQGALSPPFVLRLLRQLAAALEQAHAQHIIHRDIKPQNIIAAPDGHLTVIDFGIAKQLDTDTVTTMGGAFYGTLQYAAPEQIDESFGKISARTDIYALGLLGYQLLTDQFPFTGSSFAQLSYAHCHKPLPEMPPALHIPANISDFITTCTQKQPDDRFQTMNEVVTVIDGIFREEAVTAYQEYFAALLPDIDQRKRQILDRHRQRLGLSQETTDAIEGELGKTAAANGNGEVNYVDTDTAVVQRKTGTPKREKPHLRPLKHIRNIFEQQGETVIDLATGLMWQQSGSQTPMPHDEAPAYIDLINHHALAGFNDWRLPTTPELISLLEPEKQANGLFIHPFFDTVQKDCWSIDCDTEESAERVLFHNGNIVWQRRTYGSYVRCVRSITAGDTPQPALKNDPATKPAPSIYPRSIPVTVPHAQLAKTFGLPRSLAYTKHHLQAQNNTILDQTTGLMWQQSGSTENLSYADAQDYIQTLNHTRFAGYDDWRLPTVPELASLLEPEEQANAYYIDPLFEATQKSCWSADRDTEKSAARILFNNGNIIWHTMDFGAYVRAVRVENQQRFQVEHPIQLRNTPLTVSQAQSAQAFGIQGMRPRQYIQNLFEDRGAAILDHTTGLLWEKSGSGLCTYEDAHTYVDGINNQHFAGYADWRLPTMPELMSLLAQEEQAAGLFIHPIFDTLQPVCWSGDAHHSPDKAWVVFFTYGNIHESFVQSTRYVRCVRSWE